MVHIFVCHLGNQTHAWHSLAVSNVHVVLNQVSPAISEHFPTHAQRCKAHQEEMSSPKCPFFKYCISPVWFYSSLNWLNTALIKPCFSLLQPPIRLPEHPDSGPSYVISQRSSYTHVFASMMPKLQPSWPPTVSSRKSVLSYIWIIWHIK